MTTQTKEEFIEAWIDKYMEKHADEKIEDFDELREQADCAWYDMEVEHDCGKTEYDLTAEQERASQGFRKGARAVNAYGKTVKRERKPNEDKREIIGTIAQNLHRVFGPNEEKVEQVEISNVERQIDFLYRGTHYSVTLTAHRPPKK